MMNQGVIAFFNVDDVVLLYRKADQEKAKVSDCDASA